jgi:hypothetical protein
MDRADLPLVDHLGRSRDHLPGLGRTGGMQNEVTRGDAAGEDGC